MLHDSLSCENNSYSDSTRSLRQLSGRSVTWTADRASFSATSPVSRKGKLLIVIAFPCYVYSSGAGEETAWAVYQTTMRQSTTTQTGERGTVDAAGRRAGIDRTTTSSGSSLPPSIAVVEAISAAEGVEPAELDGSLYDSVDPDALDDLFSGERTNGQVVFEVFDYVVTVRADGDVRVCPTD